MVWIVSFLSFFCYTLSLLLWLFLGHFDIIKNKKMHIETFGAFTFKIKYGYGFYCIIIAASSSLISMIQFRLEIFLMGIESVKLKYQDITTEEPSQFFYKENIQR